MHKIIAAAFRDTKAGLTGAQARTILATAPTPALAAKLTPPRLRRLLVRAGRQRNIDTWADRLCTVFRAEQMRQLPQVEVVFGEQGRALLGQLDAACRAVEHLARATEDAFNQHPHAQIMTSFPGVGRLTGARLLAELGDDRTRFAGPAICAPTPGRHRSPARLARAW